MASCSEHPPEALTLSSVVVTKITFWAVVRGAKLSMPSRIVATANHRPERDRAGGFIGQQGIIRDILVLLDARVPWPRERAPETVSLHLQVARSAATCNAKIQIKECCWGMLFIPRFFSRRKVRRGQSPTRAKCWVRERWAR